jgi:hypothetical protein
VKTKYVQKIVTGMVHAPKAVACVPLVSWALLVPQKIAVI